NSGQRVIFRGSLCDGTTCPPDPIVPPSTNCDHVSQSGLPGIYAPYRYASVYQDPALTGPVSARIDPGSARVRMATTAPRGDSNLYLSYSDGTGNWSWNLDLSAALEFQFNVDGDVSQSQPLFVDLTLYDFDASIYGENATVTLTIDHPGSVVVP